MRSRMMPRIVPRMKPLLEPGSRIMATLPVVGIGDHQRAIGTVGKAELAFGDDLDLGGGALLRRGCRAVRQRRTHAEDQQQGDADQPRRRRKARRRGNFSWRKSLMPPRRRALEPPDSGAATVRHAPRRISLGQRLRTAAGWRFRGWRAASAADHLSSRGGHAATSAASRAGSDRRRAARHRSGRRWPASHRR